MRSLRVAVPFVLYSPGLARVESAAWLVSGASIASAIVLVQITPLAGLLHVEPLHAHDWALVVGGGLLALVPFAVGAVGSRGVGSPRTT